MAMTIRYVRPDSAGGGDGTTNTNSGANGAWTLAEAVAGQTSNMEIRFINSGTFSADTSSRSFINDGTGDAPILFTGRSADDTAYESAYLNRGAAYTVFSCKNSVVQYLDITSSSSSNTVSIEEYKTTVHDCKFRNTNTASTTGGCNALNTSYSNVYNCYLENMNTITSGAGYGSLAFNRSNVFGCKIVAKGRAVYSSSSHAFYNNLVIGDGIESGFYINGYYNIHMVKNNTFYNFKYGINYLADAGTDISSFVMNNLFHTIIGEDPSDPGYVINLRITTTQDDGMLDVMGNRYYNCSNFMLEDKYAGVFENNVELTSDPFVTPGTDYELNSTAGGGAGCKNISSPAYTWTWNH
jgi:hypothetical protein